MRFDILTIFPEFFESFLKTSLLGKGIASKKISVSPHNIRDFTHDKHKTVDDMPYGGGAGMVFKPEPVIKAVEAIHRVGKSLRILLTPSGHLFNQRWARKLAGYDQLILICGRYEGIDERVREWVVDEEISIGDYILSGGEAAAVVLMDAVVRLLPGFIGNENSLSEESFNEDLLEYPHYTRPPEFRGVKVPKVLLSGNPKTVKAWRQEKAEEKTRRIRPDLIQKTKTVAKEKKRG